MEKTIDYLVGIIAQENSPLCKMKIRPLREDVVILRSSLSLFIEFKNLNKLTLYMDPASVPINFSK